MNAAANSEGHVESYYSATAAPIDRCPPLLDEVAADVCVIGGGYTGVLT